MGAKTCRAGPGNSPASGPEINWKIQKVNLALVATVIKLCHQLVSHVPQLPADPQRRTAAALCQREFEASACLGCSAASRSCIVATSCCHHCLSVTTRPQKQQRPETPKANTNSVPARHKGLGVIKKTLHHSMKMRRVVKFHLQARPLRTRFAKSYSQGRTSNRATLRLKQQLLTSELETTAGNKNRVAVHLPNQHLNKVFGHAGGPCPRQRCRSSVQPPGQNRPFIWVAVATRSRSTS